MLAAGAEEGFFTLDGEGIPALTRRARERFYRWVSIELSFYAEHMQPPQSTGEKIVPPAGMST